MKTYGIIKNYDDYNGIIKGIDGNNYILKSDDIDPKLLENIQKGDYVEFTPETYNTIETNLFIARNIKKLAKENINDSEQKTKGIK